MLRTLIDERYAIVGPLGSGGMGEVYLARDELLGRDVALKVLKEEYASSEEFKARFRREAENAASLSHPNVVAVYDKGEDGPDGTPYMAMEHVPGGTLAERVAREGPLDPFEAAGIARQVALALSEAHRRGVVHRDVKPHNVFLTGNPFDGVGAVKVGDFGISRAVKATAITETDFILGSVRYISPEQARGEPVGPKSDLYSLGVVLYEMLTGRVPFEADGPIATAMKHISEPPASPRRANPDVPKGLEAVTLKLLSKDPASRYPDASALAEDLERVARGLRPRACAPSPSGSGVVRGVSPDRSRPKDRGTPAMTRKRRRRRDLGRRLSAAVVGISALLVFAAAAAAAAGLYEIPWLAEASKLSEGIVAQPGKEPSPPSEGMVPNAPRKDLGEAPSGQRDEGGTAAGADAPAVNPTRGEESHATGVPTPPETHSVAELVSYVALPDRPIRESKTEPASDKPASKQGEREGQKDSTKTTSSTPSGKNRDGVLGSKESATEEAREEQEKRAEEAREEREERAQQTAEEAREEREERAEEAAEEARERQEERVEKTAKKEKDRTAAKPKAASRKVTRKSER